MLYEVDRKREGVLLGLNVARRTEGITKWYIAEDEPRHAALLDDVTSRANDHGGDTSSFECSCGQAHGLVTDGSKRYENGDVQPVVLAPGNNVGGVGLSGTTLAVIGRNSVESR